MISKKEIFDEAQRIMSNEKLVTGIAITYGKSNIKETVEIGLTGDNQKIGVDGSTLIDLASVTKLFLCFVIFKLQEQKLIAIDDLVGNYSSKYVFLQSTSLRELMNFTCSLSTSKRIADCSDMEEVVQVLAKAKKKDIDYPEYNDINAMVLADLIEGITGETFGNLVKEIVLDKAGVKDTFFDLARLTGCNNKMVYDKELWYLSDSLIARNTGNEPHDEKARMFSKEKHLSGHAGLFSTANDMGRISQAVLNEQIISRNSLCKIAEGNPKQFAAGKAYGNLCYIKNSNIHDSEVYAEMSDQAFAISGYTGTYWMIDPIKDIYLFIGANRLNNRITRIDIPYQKNSICINEKDYIVSKNYVYEKDVLRDLCNSAMLIQSSRI